MSDITELAQSLKAAANTTADAIDRLKAFPGDELIDLSQHEGEQVDIDIATLNQWYELSSPANVLALVEALEKSEKTSEARREAIDRTHNMFVRERDRANAAEEALEKAQATEAHCNRGWIEAHEQEARAEAAEQRIAELESRTVKLSPELYTIGELIRTQDNRITDQPMFVVFQKREIIGSDERRAEFVAKDGDVAVLPLYRHAQPTPVLEREPITWLNDAYLARGVVDGEAGSEDAGPGYIPVYREAGPQPAPVVPKSISVRQAISALESVDAVTTIGQAYKMGWNACRAAMLAAAPQETNS
ncbi:ead/Ea22-like family protein [Klebsiella variicola]|uniref:ead/Ea22-like family protein n=1 Tax=Klebsiella variicola TaxID=244366 RepID=UPI001D192592|nr:ead/Ea22-like family protein [Klebsiella variicola]